MKFNKLFTVAILAGSVAFTAAGCKKNEEPAKTDSTAVASTPAPAPGAAVASLTLGTDSTASKPATEFKASDKKIYAVIGVNSAEAGKTEVGVKWTYGDGSKWHHEDKATVAAAGNGTKFFGVENAKGWPVGDYKVEVMLNGAPSGHSASFKVSK